MHDPNAGNPPGGFGAGPPAGFGAPGGMPGGGMPGPPGGLPPAPPAGPRTDALAIVALVAGLLAVAGAIGNLITAVFGMCCPLCTVGGALIGIIVAIPAVAGIVTGILSARRTTHEADQYTGKGMAITGIVTGALALVMTAITVVGPWLGFGCMAATAPDRPRGGQYYPPPIPIPSPPPLAPPPAPTPTYAINAPFQLGSYSYQIDQVEVTDQVGRSRYTRVRPSPGAVFLVIRYTETNNGTETQTGAGSPIQFRDGQARTYQPSSRAETALMMEERGEILPQLQPGVAHEGATVFEIPQDAAFGAGTLIVTERGALGSNTAEVTFQVPQG